MLLRMFRFSGAARNEDIHVPEPSGHGRTTASQLQACQPMHGQLNGVAQARGEVGPDPQRIQIQLPNRSDVSPHLSCQTNRLIGKGSAVGLQRVILEGGLRNQYNIK